MTLKEFILKLRESDNCREYPMKKTDGVWFMSDIDYADIATASAFDGKAIKIKGQQYTARFEYPKDGYKASLKLWPATSAKQASFSASDLS